MNENANIIYGLNKLCHNQIKQQQQQPSFTPKILGSDIVLHKQILPHVTTKIGSCFAFSFLAYLLDVQNQKKKIKKQQQQPPSFTSQILGLDIDLHKQVLPHATRKIGSCFVFSFLAYLLNVQN